MAYIDRDFLLKDIDESVVFSVRSGKISSEIRGANKIVDRIKNAPTADVVEVDKVAEMFAEQFGDKCPCNFNSNDEWLPYVCEHTNTCDCPCKEGWKQFVKYYAERKTIMNGGK